jgi:hypothetical protein
MKNGCISLAAQKNEYGRPETGSWWCNSLSNYDNLAFVMKYEAINDENKTKKVTVMKFEIVNDIAQLVEIEIVELSFAGLDPPTWAKLCRDKVTTIEERMLGRKMRD